MQWVSVTVTPASSVTFTLTVKTLKYMINPNFIIITLWCFILKLNIPIQSASHINPSKGWAKERHWLTSFLHVSSLNVERLVVILVLWWKPQNNMSSLFSSHRRAVLLPLQIDSRWPAEVGWVEFLRHTNGIPEDECPQRTVGSVHS